MKVIFLDIDGVLNNLNYWQSMRAKGRSVRPGDHSGFDPSCVKLVKDLINAAGAKVVVSSAWRLAWDSCRDSLGKVGIIPIDKTAYNDDSRGDQIKAWLQQHPNVTNFVVIDDTNVAVDNLILVGGGSGFQSEHLEAALDILTSEVKDSAR